MLTGCFSSNKILNTNFAYVYRKDVTNLHSLLTVFHTSDHSSRIYYKLNSAEFLYQKNEEGSFTAPIKISYRLYHFSKTSEIADTGSILLHPSQADPFMHISDFFDIKTPGLKDYILEIDLYDKNRNQHTKSFILIEKSNVFNRQNFHITSADKQSLFRNYIDKGELFIVTHRDTSIKKLYVRYYNRDFPLPLPPFSMDNQRPLNSTPDSMFILNNSLNTPLHFEKEGFYHIQTDTTTKDGVTLFCFHNNFPQLTAAADLLYPLRYLTTKKEFNDLLENKSPKTAIDQFWLSIGTNQDRAKVLIRNYYGRVQDANTFFTSYIEGWKTDRGLVYIVLGIPKFVFKTSNSESWIYGEATNRFSLNFTFEKVRNPFTENDFSLSRSVIYENPWYKAVELWRDGRIINN